MANLHFLHSQSPVKEEQARLLLHDIIAIQSPTGVTVAHASHNIPRIETGALYPGPVSQVTIITATPDIQRLAALQHYHRNAVRLRTQSSQPRSSLREHDLKPNAPFSP